MSVPFAQRVAQQILNEAQSGSAVWDEMNGPSAVLRQYSDTRFTITIPQEYDGNDRPTENVCLVTVEYVGAP
jgi:hypothetical protein